MDGLVLTAARFEARLEYNEGKLQMFNLFRKMSLKKFEELLGELPKDVKTDPYYQKEFLNIYGYLLDNRGEQWIKDHRVMLLTQWEYVRTLV